MPIADEEYQVHMKDGTITVVADAKVYPNEQFYAMDNLFDGDYTEVDKHDSYWLAKDCRRTTMTFDFPSPLSITRIRLAPRCRSDSLAPDFQVRPLHRRRCASLTDMIVTAFDGVRSSPSQSTEFREKYWSRMCTSLRLQVSATPLRHHIPHL